MFIRDLEEAPPKMQNALQDQNTRTIQRILHTMKGLSGTLGATTLAGKLAEQERQLPRHGDLTTLKEKVSQITELLNLHQLKLERLYQELVKITHQHPDAISEHRPSKLDPKRLRDMLTLLREQLANADMEATATMLLLNGQVGMALEQEYQLLESAVNRLDFDTAQQLCNNLLESTKN